MDEVEKDSSVLIDELKKDSTVDKRYAVLVVHGVGEQGRYEFIDGIATHFKKTLQLEEHDVHAELHVADSVPRLSPQPGWCESPISLRWRDKNDLMVEAVFREAHWADLDMPNSLSNWIRLLAWSLSFPGVRLFGESKLADAGQRGMRKPKATTLLQRLGVRCQLFLVSLSFLLMLSTIGFLDFLLRRLSLKLPIFITLFKVIYNYLGDVKLYQDWFLRQDERLETIGQKSRFAIRRRMNRALLQTAAEVERGELDGFYIFAHSLGTVVAFNGLMEHRLNLPHCLTRQEWRQLPQNLKGTVQDTLPQWLDSDRPPWLDEGEGWNRDEVKLRDYVDRSQMLCGLQGFVTVGSPLDKFAVLWPQIVLINDEGLERPVPWINIADIQDIVAGRIDYLEADDSNTIGGLELKKAHDFRWANRWEPATAHISYWKAGKKKAEKDKVSLSQRLIEWIGGGNFQLPDHRLSPSLSRILFWAFTFGSFVLLLLGLAAVVWSLIALFGGVLDYNAKELLSGCLICPHDGTTWGMIKALASQLLLLGVVIILVFSVVRNLWERIRFDLPKK